MKPPKLRKKLETKKLHGKSWKDYYSWIHQDNILEVLKDPNKLNPEVRKYLIDENIYAKNYLKESSSIQKLLFKEIKAKIKLSDKSLTFKYKRYSYWSKTTKTSNYPIMLRKRNGRNKIEEYWNGEKEKKKLGVNYFDVESLCVSHNDKLLSYSLDLKGSEYYTIYIRDISKNKLVSERIKDTSGGITFSLDDKYIFYTKLDKFHRKKNIFAHKIGTSPNLDILIFDEKNKRFSVDLSISSDKKFFFISSGDHSSTEVYYFPTSDIFSRPKLFKKNKKGIIYSIDSWNNNFYIHTNENADDFKICTCPHKNSLKLKELNPSKYEVLIGGFLFLKDWMIRYETSNVLEKIYLRNLKNDVEEEIKISKEELHVPSIKLRQENRNTNLVHISYSSPRTPYRTYLYDLKTKKKKLIKKQIIPSGYKSCNYMVERKESTSHDGRKVPITIIRHKDTLLNGKANLILYGYGAYGYSLGTDFSSSKFSLIDRGFIWAVAHVRGGMERGMKWWKEGKMMNKKNSFEDYLSVSNFLIENNYTKKGSIIGMGGSAGGLLIGAVLNKAPELFLGAIMAVPFVDTLTTNLDHSLPLTIGEFQEFGNAKRIKRHFEYIYSYSPYNNISFKKYPNILITTSLSDNRVLFDEPAKFVAKLRDYKKDNNILLLKTEMNAGHGGKTGRDNKIEELAYDYSFIIKITNQIKKIKIK